MIDEHFSRGFALRSLISCALFSSGTSKIGPFSPAVGLSDDEKV